MDAILDVGANDGFHGIIFAFLNPHIKVYAFEPLKGLKKEILNNVKKVQLSFNIKLKNYKLINHAVSDFNGYRPFNLTHAIASSSLLNPKRKLHSQWTNSKDLLFIKDVSKQFSINKRLKVKVITLKKFCDENNVNNILYLHVDAQGADLRVLKGLKNYRRKIHKGVIEVAKNKKLSIYVNGNTLSEVRKNFKKWNYKIIRIESVLKNIPEFNVYFENMKYFGVNDKSKKISLPSNRKERFFRRLFDGKLNWKDLIFKNFYKIELGLKK